MPQAVVEFSGVWKKFRRGERHDSLRDLVPSLTRRLFRRTAPTALDANEFWAIEDLSFAVCPGEAVGIIGPNGAGKSTALKLLTRILRPTKGTSRIVGRVGALIEVAAGFHGDLTGRENIFLQGSIMGMRQQEIAEKLDDIVDFSGISPFIDTQVKRYSSGMQARLGFSVAAYLDPDVLIVDEVLSVGDLSFQQRCTERMRRQIEQGTTVVFVSHNLQAVSSLCSRVIVMRQGRLVFDGEPVEGLEAYVRAGQSGSSMHGMNRAAFELIAVTLTPSDVCPRQKCTLSVGLRCLRDEGSFNIGFEVERLRDLAYCYGITSEGLGQNLFSRRVGEELWFEIHFNAHLLRGHYRINVNLRDPVHARYVFYGEAMAVFSVDESYSHDGIADLTAVINESYAPLMSLGRASE